MTYSVGDKSVMEEIYSLDLVNAGTHNVAV
jgi:hypothetical protein